MMPVSLSSPTLSDSGFSMTASSCETLTDSSITSPNSTVNSLRSIFSKLKRKKSSPSLPDISALPTLRGARSVPDLPRIYVPPPPVPPVDMRQRAASVAEHAKPKHIPLGPTAERYQRLGSELIAESSALRTKKLERLTGLSQGPDKSKRKLLTEIHKSSPKDARRSLSIRQRKQSLQDSDSDSETKSPTRKLNFDRLVLSDETVKVSLTSNRLNTIESGKKHQARQMQAREPVVRGRLQTPPHSPLRSSVIPRSPGRSRSRSPSLEPMSPLTPPKELNVPAPLPKIPPPPPPQTLNTLVEEQESEEEEERVVQILTEIAPPLVIVQCESESAEEEKTVIKPRPASLVLCRTKLVDHELAHGRALPELDSSVWGSKKEADKESAPDELSLALWAIKELQLERDSLLEQLRVLGH